MRATTGTTKRASTRKAIARTAAWSAWEKRGNLESIIEASLPPA
jgi:hypothetical protein